MRTRPRKVGDPGLLSRAPDPRDRRSDQPSRNDQDGSSNVNQKDFGGT